MKKIKKKKNFVIHRANFILTSLIKKDFFFFINLFILFVFSDEIFHFKAISRMMRIFSLSFDDRVAITKNLAQDCFALKSPGHFEFLVVLP